MELYDFSLFDTAAYLQYGSAQLFHAFLKVNLANLFTHPIFKVIIFHIRSEICLKDTCANFAQLFGITLARPKTLCFSLKITFARTIHF